MILLEILIKSFWAGIAAIGFAILFNVPRRTLFPIWSLGAMGGLIKFTAMNYEMGIVFASFLGAVAIGIVAIRVADLWNCPPLVFFYPFSNSNGTRLLCL